MSEQAEPIPTLLTLTGVARETRCCVATLKRRVEDGIIAPDFILVETVGRPGSLVFKSERLPEIALLVAQKPKA